MAITRDELIAILAEADPVGLIADGGRHDEYAAEADAILALHGVPKLTEITGVFAVSFSDPGACPRETARWIAAEMVRRADAAGRTPPGAQADRMTAPPRDEPSSPSR